ncbi:MAG TPA: hypothetical protein VHY22_07940 [Chthoniobacteraceae bacterium]|jgi:hypothetical protein|nr:hypothetical protein [Chthoniobacteraceae bacterium]
MKKLALTLALLPFLAGPLIVRADDSNLVTVKGEILDMACYLDHGAQGEKHAACAQKCISSGLPVGIKDTDGKVYFVIGAHKPMNDELAPYGGKTVTLKGKAVTRNGINLLENAEIVK